MPEAPLRVIIAGGGTGGHVIPALAVARELKARYGAEVRFIGTARGIETRLVPDAGFPLDLIEVGQLNRVSLATRLKTAAGLPASVWTCVQLLRRFRPHVVFGVGGYASGPAMVAAMLTRTPRVVFEPNAIPGMTNRIVGRWVQAAAVNFPETARYFRNAKVTGIPVREEFFHLPPRPVDLAPQLLVFGGSQGARVLNRTMPKIASALLKSVPGLTIIHQSGPRHLEETQEAYRQAVGPIETDDAAETSNAGMRNSSSYAAPPPAASPAETSDAVTKDASSSPAPPIDINLAETNYAEKKSTSSYKIQPFLDDMPQQFAAASLVLCRSGASTMAELAAAGKPSLLIPFPLAADDHQRRNAEAFVRAGAAAMLLESELTADRLLQELTGLLRDSDRLSKMGTYARAIAHPEAAREIAEMLRNQRHA